MEPAETAAAAIASASAESSVVTSSEYEPPPQPSHASVPAAAAPADADAAAVPSHGSIGSAAGCGEAEQTGADQRHTTRDYDRPSAHAPRLAPSLTAAPLRCVAFASSRFSLPSAVSVSPQPPRPSPTMVLMSVLNACLVTLTNAERRGKRQVLIRPVSKVVVKFLQVRPQRATQRAAARRSRIRCAMIARC